MEYKNKVAIVTGGAHGIGKCIAEEFRKKGASVADMREGDHFVGDISKKEVLEAFADEIIGKYGKVDYIIHNALPLMKGLDLPWRSWLDVNRVNSKTRLWQSA